jgi:hypothetical protein
MFKVNKVTIDWLLESTGSHAVHPIVYLTLTNLLEKSHRSKQVRDAYRNINDYGPIKKILAKAPFFWRPGEFLFRKYEGGFWQLSFLADLYANPDHPEIRRGIEFILQRADEDGFYSVHCLSANLYRAMMQFGYASDDRVVRGVEYQCERIVKHNGADCFVMDYSLLPTCHMTVSKVLLALAYVPEERFTPLMKRAKNLLIKEMRDTKIYVYVPTNNEKYKKKVEEFSDSIPVNRRRSIRDEILDMKKDFLKSPGLGRRLEKTEWMKFGYPNSYNSDILDTMFALAVIGARRHKEFSKAIDIIKKKVQTERGGRQHWELENSLNENMIAPVEEPGKPSKWITYRALYVLKHFEGLSLEK